MDGLEIPVTLVIKAPNQKVADHTVECALTWTIKKLKEHLSRVYPSQPKENLQRIIYSGKLLQDHLQLKDILRKDVEVDVHTVHLVCAHTANNESSQSLPQPAEMSKSASQSSSHHPSPVRTPPPTPTATASTDGVRHRGTPQQDYFQQQLQPGANPYAMYYNQPGAMQYTPEQMMWMQQMYAQQMYSQYMQMYQQAGIPTPPHTPLAQQPITQPVHANQNVAENAAPNRPANPNQRMNAGAAGAMFDEDEEEEVNRDWLDWIYMMSRFGILLTIVYFYSTFGRFVFVLSFFVFMYMYQAGWFRLRRRNVRQPAQEQENQPQQQQNQRVENVNPNAENQQAAAEGEGENQSEESEEVQAPIPEPRPGIVMIAWNFFSSFFSSLIPQQPPPVNIN